MNTQLEQRTGARNRASVPKDVLRKLNAGEIESVNLVEILSIDFRKLLPAIGVPLSAADKKLFATDVPFTQRTRLAGTAAYKTLGKGRGKLRKGGAYATLLVHPSDTARGIAAYAVCEEPGVSVQERLDLLKPLAADRNQSVREWAWVAVRQQIIDELDASLSHLERWSHDPDENVRRFASEATRPRGVWCPHIRALREQPARGLPILKPLSADPSRYVQNSVANWLNDASKDDPEWVIKVCTRWESAARKNSDPADAKATAYIVKRALRTIRKQQK